MKLFIVTCALSLLTSFQNNSEVVIDKTEAQKACYLLMDIRRNPGNYHKELGFPKSTKPSAIKLKWNDKLAGAAEAKAIDMAKRDYFGHVDPDGYGINYFINESGYKLVPDWIKNKSLNYFESLAVNTSGGEESIKYLIIDAKTPSLGHRKHLLGLDKWNASLTDIGIGFARRENGSKYKTYTCIIIAKHDW